MYGNHHEYRDLYSSPTKNSIGREGSKNTPASDAPSEAPVKENGIVMVRPDFNAGVYDSSQGYRG